MLRALPSSLLVAIALAACGGGKKTVKLPQVSIPGPMAWDGTPPAGGTVTIVSSLPGNATQFVAYEVDPNACSVRRTIVDELEKLKNLVVTTITNPMDNAGAAVMIGNPPPPPPDGEGLLREARLLMGTNENQVCQPPNPKQ